MKLADPRQGKGKRAEDAAVRALKARGYRILHRNYRERLGELDIIAEDREALVFVEVRSKSEGGPLRPIETIVPSKRRRLIALAQLYLAKHNTAERACRFDVVEVTLNSEGKVSSLEVLADAFRA